MSGGAPQFEKLPEMIQFGGLVAIANTSLALLAVSVLWLDPLLLALLVVPLVTVFLAYRAYVSEREKHERLELLYQSSRILQHSPELDSALSALLDHAREMFRAERAEVLLWPRDGTVTEGLFTRLRAGPRADDDGPAAAGRRRPAAPARRPRARARSSTCRPTAANPASATRWRRRCCGEAGLIGSMVIANRLTEGTTFSDDDLRLLETLANQAAVALENGQLEQSLAELSRLKEQLRFQAYHDPLTGLANRSLFAEQVNAAHRAPDAGPGAGRPVPRPRQLQGRQRRAGAPRRRPAARRRRRAGPVVRPDRGHGRAPRRRRVRDAAARRARSWARR